MSTIVILAALEDRTHVQVGRAHRNLDAADAVYDRLDSAISGFFRTADGRLRWGNPSAAHFINGQAVKFYRMRTVDGDNIAAEFGNVERVPLSAIRKTAGKSLTSNTKGSKVHTMNTTKTPSGIKRPTTSVYANWSIARTSARMFNEQHGRGYRALKTANGDGYTVIFRPAVAINKQRKNREIV